MPRGRFLFRKAISGSAALRARAWNPLKLGSSLFLWVDATDAATVSTVPVSGDLRIQQIDDKSGNGRHLAQPTANWRPNYIASGVGGKPSIQHDNSRFTHLRNTFGVLPQPFTFAIAFRSPNTATLVNSHMIVASANINDPTSTATQTALNFFFSGGAWNLNQFAGSGFGNAIGNVVSFNDYQAIMQYDGAASVYGVNGSNVASNPSNRGISGVEIGGWNGGGLTSNVTIGELVVLSSTLSVQDRQLLEGYFAWKWGGP